MFDETPRTSPNPWASSSVPREQNGSSNAAAGAASSSSAPGLPDVSRSPIGAPVQLMRAAVLNMWAEDGAPIQSKGSGEKAVASHIHEAAAHGINTPATSLPFAAQIQAAFGCHDISGIRAHINPTAQAAADSIGAQAYASGQDVVFSEDPDLHTAVHETAHIIQQRGGVQLKGGVGAAGDHYELNADAVADRVVAGQSAVDLLPGTTGAGQAAANGVQMIGKKLNEQLTDQDEKPLANNPADGIDNEPGKRRIFSVESYERMWEKEQGRPLTDEEKATIDRGCIGITANNLHGGGNPLDSAEKCFGSFAQAHAYMEKREKELDQKRKSPSTPAATKAQLANQHAVMFAKMFWSNQKKGITEEERDQGDDKAFRPNPKTGEVDMSRYDYIARGDAYTNFDYAFWDEDSQSFWHANHKNPGMHVYQSTKERFAEGYVDFDRTIYCVAIAENYNPGLAALAHTRR